MTDIILDSLPVSQLPDRYGIVRSVVYTRLSDLHIRPEKRGNKSYINAADLALLDALHEFIQAGGTTAEFLDQQGLSQPPEENGETGSLLRQADRQLEASGLMMMIDPSVLASPVSHC